MLNLILGQYFKNCLIWLMSEQIQLKNTLMPKVPTLFTLTRFIINEGFSD